MFGRNPFASPVHKPSHLASLPVEISAQFSRHVDGASAAAVVADVHHVVLDPHVVGAFFGYVVFGNLARIENVGHVDDVHDPLGGDPCFVGQVELHREHFVTEEDVILVAEDRVGAGQPSRPVQLAVVETQLADELRVLGAAALDAVPHVEDHEPVFPVAHVDQAVDHLDIVQHIVRR